MGPFLRLQGGAGTTASSVFQGWRLENPGARSLALITMESARLGRGLDLPVPGLGGRKFRWREYIPVSSVEAVRAGFGGLVIDAEEGTDGDPEDWNPPPPVVVRTYWVPKERIDLSLAGEILGRTEKAFRAEYSSSGGDLSCRFEREMKTLEDGNRLLEWRGYLVEGRGGTKKRKETLYRKEAFFCVGDRVFRLSCVRVPLKADPFRKGGVWDRTREAFRFRAPARDRLEIFLPERRKTIIGILIGILLGFFPYLWLSGKLKRRERELRNRLGRGAK